MFKGLQLHTFTDLKSYGIEQWMRWEIQWPANNQRLKSRLTQPIWLCGKEPTHYRQGGRGGQFGETWYHCPLRFILPFCFELTGWLSLIIKENTEVQGNKVQRFYCWSIFICLECFRLTEHSVYFRSIKKSEIGFTVCAHALIQTL